MTAADGILAYHRLEAARDLFQSVPASLDFGQTAQADARASAAAELESRILAASEASGVTLPSARLEAAYDEIADRYGDPAEMTADLAANGLTPTELRTALDRKLRAEALLDKIASEHPPVTEERVRAAYDARAEKLVREESRQARHILITINPDFPENTRSAALTRIKMVKAELGGHPDPEAFADAVQKHSECPSALEGGVIGKRITPGKLYPEIDAVLFDLPEGGLGGPVETELGLHLVWCEEILPAGPIPYDEIAPKLREALENAEKRKAKQAWLAELQERTPS